MADVCRSCGFEGEGIITLCDTGMHYARLDCGGCGSWIKWIPKPENEEKRPKQKYSAKQEGVTRCQLCQRHESMIGKTEVIICQHVHEIGQGGQDVLENIWWVCSSCHAEIHHRRAYFNNGQKDTISLKTLRDQFAEFGVPKETSEIIERIFKKTQELRGE